LSVSGLDYIEEWPKGGDIAIFGSLLLSQSVDDAFPSVSKLVLSKTVN